VLKASEELGTLFPITLKRYYLICVFLLRIE